MRAKEFCFHGTNECVSTFQQSQSNNRIFTLSNQAGIAHQDIGFTTPYTDNTKPMYINFTPQVIQQIGLEDPYTTKWVTIANDIGLQPHHPAAKQIWLEGVNTMVAYLDYELDITGSGVAYPYPQNHPQYVLRSCYYTDANGVRNRYSADYAFCA